MLKLHFNIYPTYIVNTSTLVNILLISLPFFVEFKRMEYGRPFLTQIPEM